MAVKDYNKKKPLEVTSQNDSSTTIDKAQPIIIGSPTTVQELDGFEDGDFSSSPTWTGDTGSASINTSESKNGSNSLEITADSSGTD